jgi:hypothetical protein
LPVNISSRVRLAADVADDLGGDHHRPQPDLDLGRAERRGVGRDHEIAGDHQAQPAGQGRAVDPGHDRLAEAVHRGQQVDQGRRRHTATTAAAHRRQIAAGRERRPGAGQHHDPDRGVRAEGGQGVDQLAAGRRADRVALVGAVQGDPGDRADVDEDRGVGGHDGTVQRRPRVDEGDRAALRSS